MPPVLSRGLFHQRCLLQQILRRPRPRWPGCNSGSSGAISCRRGRVSVAHREGPTWRERQQLESSNLSIWWLSAGLVSILGGVFAFVPLYKMYCQSTGAGGQAVKSHKEYSPPPTSDTVDSKRLITIDFNGTVHHTMPWEFVPQQRRVVVGLGETALAFYRAKNVSDKPIIGVSVYHMIPPEAGLYFNKIQCFCFDEQLINPKEEVDLPVFFYVDPLMGQDSRFESVDRITLSYLFFESDSELPEGYEDWQRATASSQAPPALAAPAAPAAAPQVAASPVPPAPAPTAA